MLQGLALNKLSNEKRSHMMKLTPKLGQIQLNSFEFGNFELQRRNRTCDRCKRDDGERKDPKEIVKNVFSLHSNISNFNPVFFSKKKRS